MSASVLLVSVLQSCGLSLAMAAAIEGNEAILPKVEFGIGIPEVGFAPKEQPPPPPLFPHRGETREEAEKEDGAERIVLVTALVLLANHDISEHTTPSADFEIPADYKVYEHEVEDGFYHSIVLRIPESPGGRGSELSCHIKGRSDMTPAKLLDYICERDGQIVVEYDRAIMNSRYGEGGECLGDGHVNVGGDVAKVVAENRTTHCGGQCFVEYTEVAGLRTYEAIGCKPEHTTTGKYDYFALAETPNGCHTDRHGYRTRCLCASNYCNRPILSSPDVPVPEVQGIRQLQAWIAENFNISLKNTG